MSKLIGLLDCDCFYVSCERLRNPSLRDRPVAVLSNQDACCIANSYEMKARGVKTGMPIWDAKKLCPEAIFVRRDFVLYEKISRQVLDLLQQVSPCVEYYSIDEMFFDADWLERSYQRPLPAAVRELQRQIRDEIGVPVSIGISLTKVLAKLGSDASKPYGCDVLLDRDHVHQLLATLPVGEIWGISRGSIAKLERSGVRTCKDFADLNRHVVRELLTVVGERLWFELHGVSVLPIQTVRTVRKSIARGGSLHGATDDRQRIEGWLVRNLERLIEALEIHQVLAGKLTVQLQYKNGPLWQGVVRFPEPTTAFVLFVQSARAILDGCPPGRVAYMHVIAEQLCSRDDKRQLSFFAPPDQRLDRIKKAVNNKCGRWAVRSGTTAYIPDIYDDPATWKDICDVPGKMCF